MEKHWGQTKARHLATSWDQRMEKYSDCCSVRRWDRC